MQVISIEEKAFYELLRQVIQHLDQHYSQKIEKWVTPAEAMAILGIKSKTTLQKLRDDGVIRFSHPERRIILYDRESLYEYLEAYAKEPFAKKRYNHGMRPSSAKE
ncbi:MAG: helix-turn-helix domain-containing protein [Chitinophagaceae bacterium]